MWSIISAAGWPIWPLIFGSVIALAIIFERAWALRRNELLPPGLVNDVCKTLPQFKERQNLQRLESHSALGGVLAAGIAAFHQGTDVETAMQDRAVTVQRQLEKHLDILSLIASAAPLMGLLGTIIGMIEIFAVQGSGTQTPEAIAGGIAVALYNTAFGLIVAIPALVAYRMFRIRIENLLDSMGEALKPFEDALRQTANTPTRRPA
ncbi:MAG TPA: MotA/TolQ/ExbB proton channel family protein [Limnobacter sp.]|nr:MotA/TolQ/ExbB proton channel family protein [Limnobacter sp.]